jgi:tetratricopeptide (TPR) repeat protein
MKEAAQCAQHYQAESYKVALKKCEVAAQAGDLNSQWLLANIYHHGVAGQPDLQNAAQWYKQAAINGHTGAQREFGKLLFRGKGVERDIQQAIRWLTMAAREDDHDAEFYMGVIYMGGKDFRGDQASALHWFKRAAASGHKMAINNLAWLYATSTNPSLRNGTQAVALMLPLLEGEPDSPVFLDTLAAAYAESGDFATAIKTQQQAIGLLPQTLSSSIKQGYQQRLQFYQAAKPWREEVPDWGDKPTNKEG